MLRFLLFFVSFCFSNSAYLQSGIGFTQYEAKEFNQMMELLASRSSDSTAGFNNYDVDPFNGHPYLVFEGGVIFERWRLGLELEYWVEEFSQDAISFYTQRHKDDNAPTDLNCQALQNPSFTPISGSITGCVFAKESFSFLPFTFNVDYAWFINDYFRLSSGLGLGYLFGEANITVKTDYYSGRINGDEIDFTLDIGHNPVYKIQSSFSYSPFRYLSLEFRAAYRISQIEQLKVSRVKGSSEIFQIVMGKPIISGQQLYIESFPGLGSDENELSLLVDDEKFKGSKYYNSIQGDLNGFILSLRLSLNIPYF